MPTTLFAGHAVAAAMEHAHSLPAWRGQTAGRPGDQAVGMPPCTGSKGAPLSGATYLTARIVTLDAAPARTSATSPVIGSPRTSAGLRPTSLAIAIFLNPAALIAPR